MAEKKLNPLSMAPEDAARVLSKTGGKPVSDQQVANAITAGAPVDTTGNINLVHLAAWLLKDLKGDGD